MTRPRVGGLDDPREARTHDVMQRLAAEGVRSNGIFADVLHGRSVVR